MGWIIALVTGGLLYKSAKAKEAATTATASKVVQAPAQPKTGVLSTVSKPATGIVKKIPLNIFSSPIELGIVSLNQGVAPGTGAASASSPTSGSITGPFPAGAGHGVGVFL